MNLVPRTVPDVGLDAVDRIRSSLNAALRGKADVVELVLACLLARGHLLLEDLPGLGKTTLAKALAQAIGGKFARVQCTPDLLPGDITGFRVYDQKTREFEFLPGPVFADVLLADEINRAMPRTQSALLEAMAERQATIDNVRHVLADAFFVIATQNPVEQHGTYPLPEAQLDRFAMKLQIGYPGRAHELEMLKSAVTSEGDAPDATDAAVGPNQLRALQAATVRVAVEGNVREYLVDLAEATRRHRQVTLGLSPRGLLIWQRLAQARAFLDGRTFTTPDDVIDVARPVLSVRLGLEPESTSRVLEEILSSVAVPTRAKKGMKVNSMETADRRETLPGPVVAFGPTREEQNVSVLNRFTGPRFPGPRGEWSARSSRWTSARALLALVCLCALSAGCQSGDSADDVHDDHDHAGHDIPAHKPKDFPAAVHRLRELNTEISGKISDGGQRAWAGDPALPNSLDIANWLPEIAADSDMPEKPWNEANARAVRIAADYREAQWALGAGGSVKKAAIAVKRAAGAISELELLLAATDPAWFPRRDQGKSGH